MFEEFKAECLKFQKKYSLSEYEINFFLEDLGQTLYAMITIQDPPLKKATIVLNKRAGQMRGFDLRETAEHEICHLFLANMNPLPGFNFFKGDGIAKDIYAFVDEEEKIVQLHVGKLG